MPADTACVGARARIASPELVAQSLPHVLNPLAECAPAWLQVHCPPAWVARYAAHLSAYRLPKAAAARSALAAQIGADGPQLLSVLWAADAPPWLRTLPALEALRQIWVQQYHLTARIVAASYSTRQIWVQQYHLTAGQWH